MKKALSYFCMIVLSGSNVLSREIGSNLPVQADSGSIDVDGGKLFYEMAGEGETIVLLHDGILHRVI